MPSKRAVKSHALEAPEAATEISRQLLNAQEEERRRISRELHDETGQALMVLRFHLEMLSGETRSEEQQAMIRESLDLLDRTIEGLRRTIARLSPRVLEELGLTVAIRRQAELLTKRTGIKADLELPDDLDPLEHELEVALYRSVQEALHNIVKHSRAKRCSVRLTSRAGRVLLQIEDDGVGFSPRSTRQNGFGLTGMRERAVALGGSMTLRSHGDKGTLIKISFPLLQGGKRGHDGGKSLTHVSAA